jgi:hypothetical protein
VWICTMVWISNISLSSLPLYPRNFPGWIHVLVGY